MTLQFTVDGKPEPAGSKSAFVPRNPATGNPYQKNGRIIVNVVDSNPKAKSWKRTIAYAARMHHRKAPSDLPISLALDFTLTRPQSHYGTGRNANMLKADAPEFPTSKPDCLKCARAVEDALTGIIYTDDAQIVDEKITKRYGRKPGVAITVSEIEQDAAEQMQIALPDSTTERIPTTKTAEEDQCPFD